jgi:hypothetical protein
MVFFFVLLAAGGEQKVFGQAGCNATDPTFHIKAYISKTPQNIYKVHFAYSGSTLYGGGGLELQFKLRFYSGNTLVHTEKISNNPTDEEITFLSYCLGAGTTSPYWYPANLTSDYVLPTSCNITNLSQITSVRLYVCPTSTFGDWNGSGLGYDVQVFYNSFASPIYTYQSSATCTETVIEQTTGGDYVTIGTNAPLSASAVSCTNWLYPDDFQSNYICGQGHLINFIASGGCPPYSYSYSSNTGTPLPPTTTDIPNLLGDSFSTWYYQHDNLWTGNASGYLPFFVNQLKNVFLYPINNTNPFIYTVTVTDNAGASATASYGEAVNKFVVTAPAPTICEGVTSQITITANNTAIIPGTEIKIIRDGSVIATYSDTNNNPLTFPIQYTINQGGNYSVESSVRLSNLNTNYCPTTISTFNVESFDPTINPNNVVTGQYVLSSNTTWNTNKRIAAKIVIPSGVTLNINNATVVFSTSTSGITVLKGGRLVVNQATLKADLCPPANTWEGISVDGNWNQAHPNDYYTNGSPQHGTVIVEESSIKNAQTAIWAYDNFDVIGSDTGGGIIYVNNTTFNNNQIGINLGHFYSTQRSVIKNSFFTNDVVPESPYVDVLLNRCGKVAIYNNTFNSVGSFLPSNPNRGTGIFAVNTPTSIGLNEAGIADGDNTNNIFINLIKGIEIYNTLTAASVTNVYNNDFQSVRKGITLNSVPFATINNNRLEIPAGTSETDKTYGIMAIHSFGAVISNNYFQSNATLAAGTNSNYTNGLELLNTYQTGAPSAEIHDNHFYGNISNTTRVFTHATRFEGDNRLVNMSCNHYENQNKNDWYVVAPANYVQPLDIQGNCNEENNTFTNQWHPATDNSRKHITTQNTTNANQVQLNCANNSLPQYYTSTTVNVTNCGTVNPGCTGFLLASPDIFTDCQTFQGDVGSSLRKMMADNDYDGIVNLLNCVNQLWANAVLAGTYIDQKQYAKAQEALDRIPNDTPENIALKNYFAALIQAYSGNVGSGKTDALDILQSNATEQPVADLSFVNVLAQSAQAQLHHTTYTRNTTDKTEKLTNENSSIANSNNFILYPNPAATQVSVTILNSINANSLIISDLNGKTIKTVHITSGNFAFNISDLPTGMYLCQIGNEITKLVVIR